jgi:hypothetical protein
MEIIKIKQQNVGKSLGNAVEFELVIANDNKHTCVITLELLTGRHVIREWLRKLTAVN